METMCQSTQLLIIMLIQVVSFNKLFKITNAKSTLYYYVE